MKLKSLLFLCSWALLALNCQKSCKQQTTNHDDKAIVKIGVMGGPEAMLMEEIKAVALKDEKLQLDIVIFNDYMTPNIALNDKSIDANLFQHEPFLQEMVKGRKLDLTVAGKAFIYPLAAYAKKIKSKDQIVDGMKIAIPNDPTNEGRALMLLHEEGLIELKDPNKLLSLPSDIVNNPRHLHIIELEAPQLPRALDDVDLAIINTTFAKAAGLNPKDDGIFIEGADSPYVNIIAVRKRDIDAPWVKQLVKAVQNDKIIRAAEEILAVRPYRLGLAHRYFMIELKGITKKFRAGGRELIAVDNVDLLVKAGSIFGIIGESGAGKSSLLRSVNLLERPQSGEVWVDNKNLTVLKRAELRQLRRRIGMIFQHFNLLSSATVYDNIALPLKFLSASRKYIDDTIRPLIELTGLVGKEDNYPHQLSGGQKQRVAIARALSTKPVVLLSDEATSALDPKTTASILSLLQEINEKTGLTILLITHEFDVIKAICHEVALMDQGRIVEVSPVVDFFAHPKTPMAKRIVEGSLKMQLPISLQEEITKESNGKKYPIIRIVFRGLLVREPIISEASRQFMVNISILQSNIEFIGHSAVGFLLAELRGDEQPIKDCLAYFSKKELDYQVVGYVD